MPGLIGSIYKALLLDIGFSMKDNKITYYNKK